MRKFLFEIGASIVMITIGVSLCFFELSDYDYEYYDEISDQETVTFEVNEDNPLEMVLDDDIIVRYEYDSTYGDRVEVSFSELLNYKQKEHYIKFKDVHWGWSSWKQYYDVFVDGLKDNKITSFHVEDRFDLNEVTITCTKEAKEWIEMKR